MPAWPDVKIADAPWRLAARRFSVCERGSPGRAWRAALVHRQPKNTKPKKLDGEQEAHLIALACSEPPKGKKRWSVRLLAERFVRLECRGAHLKRACKAHSEKSAIKPWLSGQWSIPPKQNASFVWRMEDVLEVYTRPYDERFPQVCFDEKSKQLLAEVREPLAACPGRAARQDYEYERNGTANLFIISEPLVGWRHISVTERRTKIDWAHCIKELVDIYYPHAERIVLVMDNFNTHTPPPSTRRSLRLRPGASLLSWRFITPRSMVQRTWPR